MMLADLLPTWPLLAMFLTASLILAVTPGPAVTYILARTLAQGRDAGFASMSGVALGNLGNAIGASLGLAALFAVSAVAFTIVKWAGAMYLVVIGVRMILASGKARTVSGAHVNAVDLRTLFRDGFMVALLNPKTALFFAAFLPQFMNPNAPHLPQALLLGAMFVVLAAFTDLIYVLVASVIAPKLANMGAPARWGERAAGASFVGLGLLTMLTNRRVA